MPLETTQPVHTFVNFFLLPLNDAVQLTCLLSRKASRCTALVISFHELNTSPANGFLSGPAEEGRSPFIAANSSSEEDEPFSLFKSPNSSSSSDVEGSARVGADVEANTTRDGTLKSVLVAGTVAPPCEIYKYCVRRHKHNTSMSTGRNPGSNRSTQLQYNNNNCSTVVQWYTTDTFLDLERVFKVRH